MRSFTVLSTALAAFTSVASAAGFAQVSNKCSFNAYLWSVTPSAVGPEHTVAASGGSYAEAFQGEGIAIKLSTYNSIDALYNGSALTQYQYSYNSTQGLVYYALADTMGDPFAPNKVVLAPSDSACTTVTWPQGSGPSNVLACEGNSNLTLTLCA
ncbi:hypothetical protein MMC10_010239 [Thelotrema lepadinum]|nr:hypothetical protein [Thelotrema lepadinum]